MNSENRGLPIWLWIGKVFGCGLEVFFVLKNGSSFVCFVWR